MAPLVSADEDKKRLFKNRKQGEKKESDFKNRFWGKIKRIQNQEKERNYLEKDKQRNPSGIQGYDNGQYIYIFSLVIWRYRLG